MTTLNEQAFDFLREQGYCPMRLNNETIGFKKEGLSLLIITDEDDSQYLRVLLPNFYEVKDEELLAAMMTMNEVNRGLKVGSIGLTNDKNVCSCAEVFWNTYYPIASVLGRMIQVAMTARENFHKTMLKNILLFASCR